METTTEKNTFQANTKNTANDDLCPNCKGLGFVTRDVPVGHQDYGKVYPCYCQKGPVAEKRAQRLLELSNLGRLAEHRFSTFNPDGIALNEADQRNLRNAYDQAVKFAEEPAGWLLLLGSYGCGKTHLAAAIANRLIERNKAVLFVVVPDLLDHLRSTFAPDSDISYDQRFEEVRKAPSLILDDFGSQNSTPWAIEKLYQILNFRYNNKLPTVITSNIPLEDIDPRLRSRLTDESLVCTVAITAPDFRGSGSANPLAELSSLALHADQTFESYDLRVNELDLRQRDNLNQAYVAAKEYAEKPQGWIVFTGGFYCGKTHLAAAIANYRVARGYSALFVMVPDLLDYLRSAFDPGASVSYDKRFQQVRRAPLLVLDDYGVQTTTPWAQEKLTQLFNYRFSAMLPTIITTNLTLEELDKVDKRLKVRLIDKARCIIVPIIAPPYHGKTHNGNGKSHW